VAPRRATAVKEHSAGPYAERLAATTFVALAFGAYGGENKGQPHGLDTRENAANTDTLADLRGDRSRRRSTVTL
jgi:fermentation-respiration switch protein FrsA (DUF1100 family)